MPDWRLLADRASSLAGTPCYVISERSVRHAASRLRGLETSVRLRHWLSLKTQPVNRLVHVATELGFGIDVVSDYELTAAVTAGVPPQQILVNGVGKHRWLGKSAMQNLSVHLDSLAEVRSLAGQAKSQKWQVGLRCAIPPHVDSEEGHEDNRGLVCRDQFGLTREEIRSAAAILSGAGVSLRGLHFHIHTNVKQVEEYRHAIEYVAEITEDLRIEPEYVDIGGGLPISGEVPLDGTSAAETFDLSEFRRMLERVPLALPSVHEVWMENGRFLTGPGGALVVTVMDKKDRGDMSYLICDGGRVNHARMAATERHEIVLAPARGGPLKKTVICGPTCTAVDRFGGWMLPASVEPGDRVIWLNAGAYHIPLETRFSTGLSPVVWFNAHGEPEVIRTRETPMEWWGQWISPAKRQYAAIG